MLPPLLAANNQASTKEAIICIRRGGHLSAESKMFAWHAPCRVYGSTSSTPVFTGTHVQFAIYMVYFE